MVQSTSRKWYLWLGHLRRHPRDMDTILFPLTLTGRLVRLEPLTHAHAPALVAAAAESRATYAFTRVPSDLPSAEAYIADALGNAERGLEVPFATVDRRADRVVGSTRFVIERWRWLGGRAEPVPRGPDAVEIG